MRPRYITATRVAMCLTTARSWAMNTYDRLEPLLQVREQVDDLRLDRDVERGDRLVADDEPRLDRERAGDADPLPLAAGEFVRIALRVLRGSGRRGRAARDAARSGALPRGP